MADTGTLQSGLGGCGSLCGLGSSMISGYFQNIISGYQAAIQNSNLQAQADKSGIQLATLDKVNAAQRTGESYANAAGFAGGITSWAGAAGGSTSNYAYGSPTSSLKG